MEGKGHPSDPSSNVLKLAGYNPSHYTLNEVPFTVLTDEALTPGRPPCLTHRSIGKYLQPLCRELIEVPLKPTISELPDPVINRMVQKDKAFWVDKPGANAYSITDALYKYEMKSEITQQHHQEVFPRSYQYDLDCVRYRRDELKEKGEEKKPIAAHCRDCKNKKSGLTPLQLSWAKNLVQKRWREYPDVFANLTSEEIRLLMKEVGRPFRHEACIWYSQHYPSRNYKCILRKFS